MTNETGVNNGILNRIGKIANSMLNASGKLGLSNRVRLSIVTALNVGLSITSFTVGALVGSSSFFITDGMDAALDATSYSMSLVAENKSNKFKAVVVFGKSIMAMVFSVGAVGFGLWKENQDKEQNSNSIVSSKADPTIGIYLTLGGLFINGLSAWFLYPTKHKNEDNAEGQNILNNTTWKHIIIDMKSGFVNLLSSGLDWVVSKTLKYSGVDLIGVTLASWLQLQNGVDMAKDGRELLGLPKGLNSNTQEDCPPNSTSIALDEMQFTRAVSKLDGTGLSRGVPSSLSNNNAQINVFQSDRRPSIDGDSEIIRI